MPTTKLILGAPRSIFTKMKRDFRLSVSKENRDFFDICKALKSKGYSPSNFICVATREKFERDVKITIKKKVLSPPQQPAAPKYVRPPKTDAEIQKEKKQKEDELIKEQEKARQRAEEFARIKRIMGRQD